ncbi:hypothetical protein SLEP1_g4018 [Rubroshorea leprosula]|uniref:DUF4220 domain-containing protein n=1 Tax=Rubroshorea leprosula TaxID=152421 RepID=A0AAV5HY14_9ROSI|nr:hypothetical protein SLEP1_g4018 [Rubroshorea leprosula]
MKNSSVLNHLFFSNCAVLSPSHSFGWCYCHSFKGISPLLLQKLQLYLALSPLFQSSFHDTVDLQFHDTGPLLKIEEQKRIRGTLLTIRRSHEVLQVLEIELSLLYEVLHTKLSVIDSKSGFNLRIANFGCILLAIITFSLAKWHYQLWEFDMLLTYGLLIAALALDSLSIMLLVKYSDWYAIAHFKDTVKKDAASKVIERQRRWCNEVSQLNCLTYHVKGMPVWLNKLADILHLRSSLKVIKGFCCQSSQNFETLLWRFIYYEVKDFPEDTRINEVWLETGKKLLERVLNRKQKKMLDDLDYTQSLLVWHIATELCYQEDNEYNPPENRTNYRPICKPLSDYMFYLAVKQPTIMASVLDNWSTMFKKISKMIQSEVPWSFPLNEKNVSRKILDMKVEENSTDSFEVEKDNEDDGDNVENSSPSHGEVEISLSSAVLLVRGLKQQDNQATAESPSLELHRCTDFALSSVLRCHWCCLRCHQCCRLPLLLA